MATTQETAAEEAQRIIMELRRERDAALARETALAEVLDVINHSPGDPQPVFDAILDKAHKLCGASSGTLALFDGTHFTGVAAHGQHPDQATRMRHPFLPNPRQQALIDGARFMQVEDLRTVDARSPDDTATLSVVLTGTRTVLAVPLRKDGKFLGFISANRTEVRPFSEAEISLLVSLAAQAVIAMENARLLAELRQRTNDLQETLEYQTATGDVLKVISRSTFDLQPVLDTVIQKAVRLCDADFGAIDLREGDSLRVRAAFSDSAEFLALMRGLVLPLDRGSMAGRAVVERRTVKMDDLTTDPDFTLHSAQQAGTGRSGLGVPLFRDGEVVGAMAIMRKRVEPFTERQIELVSTFADQAVIAIENTRLLTEQQEALEQQTATAEVLQVINASPGNLTPVFDAMLEKAMRLCGAAFGELYTFDGENFHPAANRGVPAAYAAFRAMHPLSAKTGHGAEMLETKRHLHIVDVMDEVYREGQPGSRALVDLGGARTVLAVPLLKDQVVLGCILIYRQEVHAYSDKEIALLENFAAQAVIAMENARLIDEQREALEQQTATAEVLQVINASPGNLRPVFETLLEKAVRLSEGAFGTIATYDGVRFHSEANRGVPAAVSAAVRPMESREGSPIGLLLQTKRPVHILDLKDFGSYRAGHRMSQTLVDLGGVRTDLVVPLLKDGAVCGLIAIHRQEVRAFSDKQIVLLENFAAQAVIAIENARLINETREALEQQTATAEVLQVINASPGNLTPVFDALLEKAMRLCGAKFGELYRVDDRIFHPVAALGVPPAYKAFRETYQGPVDPDTFVARALAGEHVIHVPNLLESIAYRNGDAGRRAMVDLGGARSAVAVSLLKDNELRGGILIYRQDVGPFSDKQIALLKNFAAQAVIAMENARLLDEIRQRQNELRVTFENMGDGVAMFDGSQNLVAWNRKFQDILEVPDEIITQRRSLPDYVRYLAERGEFGHDANVDQQIRRVLETTGQMRVFERVRPNGRVIEIHSNPVAGGGFVLIYSDITERKRNEAEIAAARDAAQEAARTIEAAFQELKIAQANLIQAEKMASLGQLTAGIAHEIKNPLNFVNNFASLSVDLLAELKEAAAPGFALLNDGQRAEIDDVSAMLTSNLQKITEHGKRADGIVRAMLEHSRGASGERREVDINALADEALNLAYHGARAQDQSFIIMLERDFGDGIAPIELNPQDITRVLLNLFGNGFYAANRRAKDGARPGFSPTLKITTRDLDRAVEIRVRDNGTGIPEDIRDKLFQPFFTTKPTGEGTGLGLSITYDIVTKQHGGTISVNSEVDTFTEFVVTLPRAMVAGEGARP